MPQVCNFIKKEALAHVFSCEFCEISKNTFSYRTPPVATSKPRLTEGVSRIPPNVIKKETLDKFFPVNFVEILRAPFL